MAIRIFAAIDHHTEAAIDDFAPAYASTVVNGNPCGTTESVADDILNGHVGTELRTVVDITGFTERRVRTRDIVMITTKDNGLTDFAFAHCLVECQSYLGSAHTVCIEDASLRAYNQMILASFLNPMDVVIQLTDNIFCGSFSHFFQHLSCQAVGHLQILRVAR